VRRSCTRIAPDVLELLKRAYKDERSPAAKSMLEAMIRNAELACEEDKPVCQSPGYPVVYVRFGGQLQLRTEVRGAFQKALTRATRLGYLRPSIVHPITRENPGDNSGIGVPDVEMEYLPDGDCIELVVSFKGCGAELANIQKVLTPADVGRDGKGIRRLLLESVINAGGIPCPPVAIGLGIGGQIHYAAKISRKVISTRQWTDNNPDKELNSLEMSLLKDVNALGIGPAGVGGKTTALAVKVGMVSTHTAICPVAINFHCWTGRRSGARINADRSVEYLY
jgi:fumarate hydratase subunit alpha